MLMATRLVYAELLPEEQRRCLCRPGHTDSFSSTCTSRLRHCYPPSLHLSFAFLSFSGSLLNLLQLLHQPGLQRAAHVVRQPRQRAQLRRLDGLRRVEHVSDGVGPRMRYDHDPEGCCFDKGCLTDMTVTCRTCSCTLASVVSSACLAPLTLPAAPPSSSLTGTRRPAAA